MPREYYVYILTNASRASMYVGVTNDLPRRLAEHRSGTHDGFTKRYRLHHLVYCESSSDVWEVIAREKQIKRWRREKKAALVNAVNPTWRDLSVEEHDAVVSTVAKRSGGT